MIAILFMPMLFFGHFVGAFFLPEIFQIFFSSFMVILSVQIMQKKPSFADEFDSQRTYFVKVQQVTNCVFLFPNLEIVFALFLCVKIILPNKAERK